MAFNRRFPFETLTETERELGCATSQMEIGRLGRLIYFCAIVPLLVFGWIRFLHKPREWWEIVGMIVLTCICFVTR